MDAEGEGGRSKARSGGEKSKSMFAMKQEELERRRNLKKVRAHRIASRGVAHSPRPLSATRLVSRALGEPDAPWA